MLMKLLKDEYSSAVMIAIQSPDTALSTKGKVQSCFVNYFLNKDELLLTESKIMVN